MPIARYFKFAERGTNILTESRAGLTTFMVMAYIIFVNPSILLGGIRPPVCLKPEDAVAYAAATALIAGIMTIAMGVVGNYPLALAAGLGINAIVAFTLIAGQGPDAAGAMGVIVIEGIVITILVVIGLAGSDHGRRAARAEAIDRRRHRPLHPVHRLRQRRPDRHSGRAARRSSALAFPTQTGQFVFLLGLLITFSLYVLKIRAALIISILVTTIVALIAGVTKVPDDV